MCLAAPAGAPGDMGVIGGVGVPGEVGVSGGLETEKTEISDEDGYICGCASKDRKYNELSLFCLIMDTYCERLEREKRGTVYGHKYVDT